MESIIEHLPKVVAKGRKEVEKILERLTGLNPVALQTNEYVLPAKDVVGLYKGFLTTSSGEPDRQERLNRLIYGDNLLAMQALLAGDPDTGLPSLRGKLDVIYIDPPYDSKSDYRMKITLPGKGNQRHPTVIEQFAYTDTWTDGTVSYLQMLYPRLLLMKELLSPCGTIYVHLDWHVGHYVKLLLDDIFGKENFVNEIVWHYESGGIPERSYAKKHDVIFMYSKTKDYYFNREAASIPRNVCQACGTTLKQWNHLKKQSDETGRVFRTIKSAGKVYKYYDDEPVLSPDVWLGINHIQQRDPQRTGYFTQKPEALLERIIAVSCPENGVVADFFAGAGTTAAVAERLGRKWIVSEVGRPATTIIRKRLIDMDSRPFLYQSIADSAKEKLVANGAGQRIGELTRLVLRLFGATPLSEDQTQLKNLGYVKSSQTLVVVDSPVKRTGLAALKKAQKLRDSSLGDFAKVVVLGWSFVEDIAAIIQNLQDDKLDVLEIPPDLIDQVSAKSADPRLRKSGQIQFLSLRSLVVNPPVVASYSSDMDEIVVELESYALLTSDVLSLGAAGNAELQAAIDEDPLSLIEYWSVDPDYDGHTFRSKWQDYRGNSANGGDPYRVVNKAVLFAPKQHTRTIAVKAVDVFGCESVWFSQ